MSTTLHRVQSALLMTATIVLLLIGTLLCFIGFGSWEGRTWPEIRTRDPVGARARDADLWAFAPPGGESYADVARRVQSFIDTLEAPALILSHGGVGRTLMTLFGAPRETTLEAPIWQGRVLRLERGKIQWLPQTGHA